MYADVVTRLGLQVPDEINQAAGDVAVALAQSASGVDVATYFVTPLMNVENGSISLPGQNADHSS